MTWIKICGTTNLEDALTAVEAGADAVGFVFYERSPRNIDAESARTIAAALPSNTEKVGVFVDADCASIRKTVLEAGLTAVQLHGNTAIDGVLNDPRPTLESVGCSKIIPMIPGNTLKDDGLFWSRRVHEKTFAILIDSQVNGGSGATFDWEATRDVVQVLSLQFPVIVAGGLNPSNVSDAMKIFQPFGVDVVSGVEASPGKKDPDKVRGFVKAVRDIDRKTS